MTFQIHGLPMAAFAPLFEMDDDTLSRHLARRVTARAHPGYPCRVSLEDASPGETLILVNYEHQPAQSPYRASHGIFVRQGAIEAKPAPGIVPEVLTRRTLSVRAFSEDHELVSGTVIEGPNTALTLTALFQDPHTAYVHLHNAGPGCYAAKATRAP